MANNDLKYFQKINLVQVLQFYYSIFSSVFLFCFIFSSGALPLNKDLISGNLYFLLMSLWENIFHVVRCFTWPYLPSFPEIFCYFDIQVSKSILIISYNLCCDSRVLVIIRIISLPGAYGWFETPSFHSEQ